MSQRVRLILSIIAVYARGLSYCTMSSSATADTAAAATKTS